MKSKYTTYILVAVVLVIWGVIIKKLFFASPKPQPVVAAPMKAEAKEDTVRKLRLDYRDPFMPKGKAGEIVQQRAPRQTQLSKGPVDIREKSDIQFAGTVKNRSRTNYIVSTRGEYITLSEGEQAGDFVFVGACADSLLFRRGEQEYYLKTAE